MVKHGLIFQDQKELEQNLPEGCGIVVVALSNGKFFAWDVTYIFEDVLGKESLSHNFAGARRQNGDAARLAVKREGNLTWLSEMPNGKTDKKVQAVPAAKPRRQFVGNIRSAMA